MSITKIGKYKKKKQKKTEQQSYDRAQNRHEHYQIQKIDLDRTQNNKNITKVEKYKKLNMRNTKQT